MQSAVLDMIDSSVYLSVTVRYHINKTQGTITRYLPCDAMLCTARLCHSMSSVLSVRPSVCNVQVP